MSSTEDRETQSCIHSLTWYDAVSASVRLKWAITASHSSGSETCCWQRLRNIWPVQCRAAITLSHLQDPGCLLRSCRLLITPARHSASVTKVLALFLSVRITSERALAATSGGKPQPLQAILSCRPATVARDGESTLRGRPSLMALRKPPSTSRALASPPVPAPLSSSPPPASVPQSMLRNATSTFMA